MLASIYGKRWVLLCAFGTEIVLTDPKRGLKVAVEKAEGNVPRIQMPTCVSSLIMFQTLKFISKQQGLKFGEYWTLSENDDQRSEGYMPSILDVKILDEVIKVTNDEAVMMARRLALEEGLLVATSLNSTECFILQSGASMFTWHGNQSTFEQQQHAAKVAEFFKPEVTLKHAKEGTES
ncbi:hypothetical protein MLD38_015886 [Melastoma candidum]|uniref:Uncharacterized protein n=1 Tax=Melastoma candidum TaxID=119954 RepID=A0ACB9RHS0_9MYRT|nr:hypothetical protein MLD38_015886 [Melastoma candidum]